MSILKVAQRFASQKGNITALRRLYYAVLLLGCCLMATGLSARQDKWKTAAQRIKRLSPSEFPNMPPQFRGMLEARGCLVPQSFGQNEPHNVIRGEFARKGQVDWAALCSRKGKSVIVVFWAAPTSCGSELGAQDDALYVQVTENNKIEFSRSLGLADEKFIRVHHEAYGGPEPPSVIDHIGIEDRFLEKGSFVFYCHRGKWLRLQGAD